MVPNQSLSRIDTLEIKALILQTIGHQRAEKYFDHLGRFFTLKISKSEFDNFCIKTIGRENIPLHNRLIRSIIKNASVSKSPPSIRKLGINSKPINGYKRNPLQSLYSDSFPPSPRKGRSRKFRDRPSPLGPLGKPQSVTFDESVSKAQSATELLSLGSRPPVEVASVEEGEEVEQMAGSPSVQSRSPVTAPLGVSIKFGAAKKSLSNKSVCNKSFRRETCQNIGELPDTRTLRSLLERKLEMEDVRVSMDCVNLLNNGLDAYLKRLVEPCLGLAGLRLSKQSNSRFGSSQRCNQTATRSSYVSMSDFRTAMELNPRMLGENWPIQLEKICSRTAED